MSKEGGPKEDLAREEVLVEEAGLMEGEGPAAGRTPSSERPLGFRIISQVIIPRNRNMNYV